MTTNGHSDDFDIGKTIFEKLKDLPPERQQRVLRWVSEGLGVSTLALAGPAAGPKTPFSDVPTPVPTLTATPVSGTTTDIKTFVAAKAPKSDNQFAAVAAYYYRFEAPPAERRDTIDAQLLQEATRLAGRNRLGNPRGTLNNAKSMGYLDGAGRGEFAINSVGENLVAMTLPGASEAPARAPRAKKPSKKSTKNANRLRKG